jgi:hypothetical protein
MFNIFPTTAVFFLLLSLLAACRADRTVANHDAQACEGMNCEDGGGGASGSAAGAGGGFSSGGVDGAAGILGTAGGASGTDAGSGAGGGDACGGVKQSTGGGNCLVPCGCCVVDADCPSPQICAGGACGVDGNATGKCKDPGGCWTPTGDPSPQCDSPAPGRPRFQCLGAQLCACGQSCGFDDRAGTCGM